MVGRRFNFFDTALTLRVVFSLWSNILDAENKFDFFCRNIPPQSRKDFIYGRSSFYTAAMPLTSCTCRVVFS
jgi:hypothetical protein